MHAAKAVTDTNTPDQLRATSPAGGQVAVNWSIAGGQNDASIGQGSIDANGLYTLPPLLSRRGHHCGQGNRPKMIQPPRQRMC